MCFKLYIYELAKIVMFYMRPIQYTVVTYWLSIFAYAVSMLCFLPFYIHVSMDVVLLLLSFSSLT